MNTRTITVSAKMKKKLEKKGVIVKIENNLPPHLKEMFAAQAEKMAMFDMYEVTVNLDMYDDFHPIHAMA